MHSWIPLLVFAGVAVTVYWVLIPKQRRQRRWSTDGGSSDFSPGSDSGSSGGWSFGDLFSSSSSTDSFGSPVDGGGSDSSGGDGGGGGGDGGGGGGD